MFGEKVFYVGRDMGRFNGSLIGSFGRVMVFEGFRADSFFGEEFHGRAEEVMKEPPLVTIEVIEEGDEVRIV